MTIDDLRCAIYEVQKSKIANRPSFGRGLVPTMSAGRINLKSKGIGLHNERKHT
jgi:hypothetical protein